MKSAASAVALALSALAVVQTSVWPMGGVGAVVCPNPYDVSATRTSEPGVLNVHLMPHTHIDAGWIVTADQYYIGSNDTQGVVNVFDSVLGALKARGGRKFTFSEVGFFDKWWKEQDAETRAAFKALNDEQRIQWVGGGWVQHDEATAHYIDMIDQMSRGHQYLAKELGVSSPRVGWQIDPFGHSQAHASMFAQGAGMDVQMFARLDYRERGERRAKQELEMIWKGHGGAETATDTFTVAFYEHYSAPPGFNWDGFSENQPQIQDDPTLGGYNIEERAAAFIAAIDVYAAAYQGPDVFVIMGDDFRYSNAHMNYRNMDRLIHYINHHPELSQQYHLLYSTPENYVQAKHEYPNATWPVKTQDFFPYVDNSESYWTGYFTSRPTTKGFIRMASAYLQAARQLEATVGLLPDGPNTDSLEEAVSLLQHHDAITGTSRQHVHNDNHMRLSRGLAEAREVVSRALSLLLASEPASGLLQQPARFAPDIQTKPPMIAEDRLLGDCPLLNVSICDVSIHRLRPNGGGLEVVLYNPLPRSRTQPIRVPLGSDGRVKVTDSLGGPVLAQVTPLSRRVQQTQLQADQKAGYGQREVVFMATLPALGWATYTIAPTGPNDPLAARDASVTRVLLTLPAPQTDSKTLAIWVAIAVAITTGVYVGVVAGPVAGVLVGVALGVAAGATVGLVHTPVPPENPSDDMHITNGEVSVGISVHTGRLTTFTSHASGLTIRLRHSFHWYSSSRDEGQIDSAYIFRTFQDRDELHVLGKHGGLELEIVEGPVVQEIRQTHGGWATLSTRLWRGKGYLDTEWMVGPIPLTNWSYTGQEVFSRWSSDLSSGNEFLHDSNGRHMMRRVRSPGEGVRGNLYPMTSSATLVEPGLQELLLVTDRSQAVASLFPGELDVLVHRRTTSGAGRGTGQPLNETTCCCHDCECEEAEGLIAVGRHVLALEPDNSPAIKRDLEAEVNNPPLVVFMAPGHDSERDTLIFKTGSLGSVGIPRNIHLITLKETEPGTFLMRLSHVFEAEEDSDGLGQPACVLLQQLLGPVADIRELSLTGVSLPTERRRWDASTGQAARAPEVGDASTKRFGCELGDKWSVLVLPMEIVTLQVKPSRAEGTTSTDTKSASVSFLASA